MVSFDRHFSCTSACLCVPLYLTLHFFRYKIAIRLVFQYDSKLEGKYNAVHVKYSVQMENELSVSIMFLLDE